MDEVLLRRLVGVVALILAAMLLTSILPGPGRHGAEAERVVTIDLTRPDSTPVEQPPTGSENPEAVAAPGFEKPEVEGDSRVELPATGPPSSPQPPPASSPQPTGPVAPKVPQAATKLPTADAKIVPAKPEARPSSRPSVAGQGRWQVQAGAYSQLERAESVRSKAAATGVPCILSPAETAQGTLYRVRCGPYATRGEGDAAAAALGKGGIKAQVVGAGR